MHACMYVSMYVYNVNVIVHVNVGVNVMQGNEM